jgi:hypothetical protein
MRLAGLAEPAIAEIEKAVASRLRGETATYSNPVLHRPVDVIVRRIQAMRPPLDRIDIVRNLNVPVHLVRAGWDFETSPSGFKKLAASLQRFLRTPHERPTPSWKIATHAVRGRSARVDDGPGAFAQQQTCIVMTIAGRRRGSDNDRALQAIYAVISFAFGGDIRWRSFRVVDTDRTGLEIAARVFPEGTKYGGRNAVHLGLRYAQLRTVRPAERPPTYLVGFFLFSGFFILLRVGAAGPPRTIAVMLAAIALTYLVYIGRYVLHIGFLFPSQSLVDQFNFLYGIGDIFGLSSDPEADRIDLYVTQYQNVGYFLALGELAALMLVGNGVRWRVLAYTLVAAALALVLWVRARRATLELVVSISIFFGRRTVRTLMLLVAAVIIVAVGLLSESANAKFDPGVSSHEAEGRALFDDSGARTRHVPGGARSTYARLAYRQAGDGLSAQFDSGGLVRNWDRWSGAFHRLDRDPDQAGLGDREGPQSGRVVCRAALYIPLDLTDGFRGAGVFLRLRVGLAPQLAGDASTKAMHAS